MLRVELSEPSLVFADELSGWLYDTVLLHDACVLASKVIGSLTEVDGREGGALPHSNFSSVRSVSEIPSLQSAHINSLPIIHDQTKEFLVVQPSMVYQIVKAPFVVNWPNNSAEAGAQQQLLQVRPEFVSSQFYPQNLDQGATTEIKPKLALSGFLEPTQAPKSPKLQNITESRQDHNRATKSQRDEGLKLEERGTKLQSNVPYHQNYETNQKQVVHSQGQSHEVKRKRGQAQENQHGENEPKGRQNTRDQKGNNSQRRADSKENYYQQTPQQEEVICRELVSDDDSFINGSPTNPIQTLNKNMRNHTNSSCGQLENDLSQSEEEEFIDESMRFPSFGERTLTQRSKGQKTQACSNCNCKNNQANNRQTADMSSQKQAKVNQNLCPKRQKSPIQVNSPPCENLPQEDETQVMKKIRNIGSNRLQHSLKYRAKTDSNAQAFGKVVKENILGTNSPLLPSTEQVCKEKKDIKSQSFQVKDEVKKSQAKPMSEKANYENVERVAHHDPERKLMSQSAKNWQAENEDRKRDALYASKSKGMQKTEILLSANKRARRVPV